MSTPEQQSPPCTARGAAGRKRRVLLVDDQKLIRIGIAAMLEDAGYEVLEAASAEQALAILKGGAQPDVLVTDYAMPDMDGGDLARAVAASWPGTPILIMTGYAIDAGTDSSRLPRLNKPFDRSELIAALGKLMQK